MNSHILALIPTYWVPHLLKRRMPQPESFRLRRLLTNIAKKRRIVKKKMAACQTTFKCPFVQLRLFVLARAVAARRMKSIFDGTKRRGARCADVPEDLAW